MTDTATAVDVTPRHFAIPDPLDPDRVTYWYQPKRGRRSGQIEPWPPRSNPWPLLRADLPEPQRSPHRPANEAYIREHLARVAAARSTVEDAIAGDPHGAAACFAALRTACCCCGRGLTDERSKVYGIGPECRGGLTPEALDRYVDAVGRAHAAEPFAVADR